MTRGCPRPGWQGPLLLLLLLLSGPLCHSRTRASALPAQQPGPSSPVPGGTAWSDLPTTLQQAILAPFPARDVARLRRVGRAWRATESSDALMPATVAELHARAHPLLVHDNPYMLYRYCIGEWDRVRHLFYTLERCLDGVDREVVEETLPTLIPNLERPTLAQVRVQVLYDVMTGASTPPLPRTQEVVRLLMRGATTDLWTPEQRRAVLFAAARHGQEVQLTLVTPGQAPHTIVDEVMGALCPATGVSDPVLHRDCLAALSLLAAPPAHVLAPRTPADTESLTAFHKLRDQLCALVQRVIRSDELDQLVSLVHKGANIHTLCHVQEGREVPLIAHILRLESLLTTVNTVMARLARLGANMNERQGAEALIFLALLGPIHIALTHDRLTMLQGLLAYGAYPEGASHPSRYYLHVVCALGTVEELAMLLSHGMRPVEYGRDHVLLGLASSKLKVQLLVRYGLRIDARSDSGETALHVAAKGSGWSTPGGMKGLLDAGADPLARDAEGNTPLHVATSSTLPVLLKAVDPSQLNVRNDRGDTPLHLVQTWWGKRSVDLLLEAGADPNVVDAQGETPLYRAVLLDLQNVARPSSSFRQPLLHPALLAHGALVDGPGGQGKSALLPAVRAGNVGMVRTLLDGDPTANLEVQDDMGRSLAALAPTDEMRAVLVAEVQQRWETRPSHPNVEMPDPSSHPGPVQARESLPDGAE